MANPATRGRKRSRQPGRYFSKKIAERRIRILTEALSLILDKGIDDFTVKELSLRAEVAEKTLYNTFGSKDAIIARAFDHFLEDQGRRMQEADPTDIDDIADKLAVRAADFFRQPEWARASNYLYFSFNSGEHTYRSLRDMALIYLRPFLKTHLDTEALSPWVPTEIIEMQLANIAHGVVHDWLMGRIGDDQAPRALVFGLLSIMMSVTRGTLHQAIHKRLSREGEKLQALRTPRG